MKLDVHERIALVGLLPTKGDYAALKTIRRAREMLSFTPQEIEFYEITSANGQVNWNPEKASKAVKDCPVDEYTANVLREKLSEMSKKKELTEQFMSVYEKFVIDYR